jgi:hypothetical protein
MRSSECVTGLGHLSSTQTRCTLPWTSYHLTIFLTLLGQHIQFQHKTKCLPWWSQIKQGTTLTATQSRCLSCLRYTLCVLALQRPRRRRATHTAAPRCGPARRHWRGCPPWRHVHSAPRAARPQSPHTGRPPTQHRRRAGHRTHRHKLQSAHRMGAHTLHLGAPL